MPYKILTDFYNDELHKFICLNCDYSSSYKHHFKKHIESKKHEKYTYLQKSVKSVKSVNNTETDNIRRQDGCIAKEHLCPCGKSYKHRQSLHYHKKRCTYDYTTDEAKEPEENQALLYENKILNLELKYEKEISNLKTTILELSKSKQIFANSTNSFNNSFNTKNEIKIFLTEQCANALSIQDFVEQLTITIDDLTNAKNNTVLGISNILERHLKPLSLTTRPVHHIDKNEWFMKDQEEWKEDDGNTIIARSHRKVQQNYLSYCSNDDITDEQYLEFIASGTKELSSTEREKIKVDIKQNCRLGV